MGVLEVLQAVEGVSEVVEQLFGDVNGVNKRVVAQGQQGGGTAVVNSSVDGALFYVLGVNDKSSGMVGQRGSGQPVNPGTVYPARDLHDGLVGQVGKGPVVGDVEDELGGDVVGDGVHDRQRLAASHPTFTADSFPELIDWLHG